MQSCNSICEMCVEVRGKPSAPGVVIVDKLLCAVKNSCDGFSELHILDCSSARYSK